VNSSQPQIAVNSKNMSSQQNIYDEYPTANEIIYRETQLVQHSVYEKKKYCANLHAKKISENSPYYKLNILAIVASIK